MLAHLLTGLRLLLALPTALVFANPDQVASWLPLLLMSIAIITDLGDGRIARRQGTASPAGQLFDHSTDCLFVACVMAGAAWTQRIPWVLPPLVLLAFAQYVLDSRFLHKQKQLRMSSLGRWNGVLYFALPLLLALAALMPMDVGTTLDAVAYGFAWALIVSTLASIVDRLLAIG